MEVDEILPSSAIKPDPIMLMLARGLFPAPTATKGQWPIVHKVLSDVYASPDAAKVAFNVRNTNIEYILEKLTLSNFIAAKVKLEDSRYAVQVLIDPSQGDPREVAERLLGPLDNFVLMKAPADHVSPAPTLPPTEQPEDKAMQPVQPTYTKHFIRKKLGTSRIKMNRLELRPGIRELKGDEKERAIVEAMMREAPLEKVAALAASLNSI